MPLHPIKHRFGGSVLFEKDCDSLRLCVEAAVEARTDLRDADLRGTYLRGADLRDAYLSGTYLRGADLRDADLRGADLSGADLRGAYLNGAHLSGAYLSGAHLSGADLIDAGQDSRGYRFVAFPHENIVRVSAGCRDFTLPEARNHWAKAHDDDPELRAECIAKVELIAAVAEARGWIESEQQSA